jgi:hypothetical protein
MKELLKVSKKFSDGNDVKWFMRVIYVRVNNGNILNMNQHFNVSKVTEHYHSFIVPIEEFAIDSIIHSAIVAHKNTFYTDKDMSDLHEYKYCTIEDDIITLNLKRIDSEYNGNSMTETYLDYVGSVVKVEINRELFSIPELKEYMKCLDMDFKVYEDGKTSRAIEFNHHGTKTVLKEL